MKKDRGGMVRCFTLVMSLMNSSRHVSVGGAWTWKKKSANIGRRESIGDWRWLFPVDLRRLKRRARGFLNSLRLHQCALFFVFLRSEEAFKEICKLMFGFPPTLTAWIIHKWGRTSFCRVIIAYGGFIRKETSFYSLWQHLLMFIPSLCIF